MTPRLLVCADTHPDPPDRGDRVRYFHFLRALRARYEVDLLLVRRLAEARERDAGGAVDVTLSSRHLAANVVRGLFSAIPVQFSAFDVAEARDHVRRMAAAADAFVALGARAALYHDDVPADMPRILDLPDSLVLSGLAHFKGAAGVLRRLYGAENLLKARTFERRLVRAFDVVVAAGHPDERWFTARYPGARIRLVPTPVEEPAGVAAVPLPAEPVVMFLGDYRFAPNVDAVRFLLDDVWPRVETHVPTARLRLVGHAPEPPLRRRLERSRCETAFSVPEIESHLAAARVFVAPMRIGSGIKVKVLTAMAGARPVVMTSLANDGIAAAPNDEALIADSPDGLANAVVALLVDDALAARVAARGRALVTSRFAPGPVGDRFLAAVDEVVAGSLTPRG